MISHYLDIHLRGDEETPVHDVLGVAFGRLHSVFTQDRVNSVGLSFPRYVSAGAYETCHALGNVIRLHGAERALTEILGVDWLRNLGDHVRVGAATEVPSGATFARWIRVQPKSSTERLMRRAMKRHDLTEEAARERYRAHVPERVSSPYISVRSTSTRRAFRLYLQRVPAEDAQAGTFSAYGLSTRTGPTVPVF